MNMALVAGMTKAERHEFKELFATSSIVRAKLTEVLHGKIDALRKKQLGMDDFDCPNWQYKQAAYLSKEKTLLEIIDLIS